jgi:hypothetical protein
MPDPSGKLKNSATPALNMVLSLRSLVEEEHLNTEQLSVGLTLDRSNHVHLPNKHSIPVFDGKKTIVWEVPSLRELFRGSQPALPNIEQYPPAYYTLFYFIETHVHTLNRATGDRTDQEMEEVYSNLRRRPDGRSLGVVHDFVWQTAALLLGSHVLSAAEYEALFGQLARSVRAWALAPVSRNYADYLRKALDSDDKSS